MHSHSFISAWDQDKRAADIEWSKRNRVLKKSRKFNS